MALEEEFPVTPSWRRQRYVDEVGAILLEHIAEKDAAPEVNPADHAAPEYDHLGGGMIRQEIQRAHLVPQWLCHRYHLGGPAVEGFGGAVQVEIELRVRRRHTLLGAVPCSESGDGVLVAAQAEEGDVLIFEVVGVGVRNKVQRWVPRVRPVEEVVTAMRSGPFLVEQGNAEEDEIGIHGDNLGRRPETAGSKIWAEDTEMGNLGRASGEEGHLDAFAGARVALGRGGVAVVTHVAIDVEEDPVWGVVAIALGERRWNQSGRGGGEGGGGGGHGILGRADREDSFLQVSYKFQRSLRNHSLPHKLHLQTYLPLNTV